MLQFFCLLGNPRAGAEEGIKFAVKDALNFNMQLHGDTALSLNLTERNARSSTDKPAGSPCSICDGQVSRGDHGKANGRQV